MPDYRVHLVDARGRLVQTFEIECRDDGHAQEVVAERAGDLTLELWDGERLVARYQPD